jgi:23S rRNA (adenine2030-N6)-methyltransferase
MNYRHVFHAGNFADCFKHAVLVWLLQAMARKDKAFAIFDTHAGAGRYDLTAGEAERTGEWRHGIGRLLGADPPSPLAGYLHLVETLGLYPGSPAIARALLRPADRLVACEQHPQEAAALRRLFARNPQVAVHERDGYAALKAFLPPQERRGLILIDPPYESAGEFDRLSEALHLAYAKFPSGVFTAWYPIKHRAPVRQFHATLRAGPMRDVVAVELLLREALDPSRLNGCGLLVVNPPWRFAEDLPPLCEALLSRLSDGEPGAGFALHRLADE